MSAATVISLRRYPFTPTVADGGLVAHGNGLQALADPPKRDAGDASGRLRLTGRGGGAGGSTHQDRRGQVEDPRLGRNRTAKASITTAVTQLTIRTAVPSTRAAANGVPATDAVAIGATA